MTTSTVKKINKMTVCVSIMRKMRTDNPKSTSAEINKLFKTAVMAHPDLLMTKNGANTYCSNVTAFLNGHDPYRHNKAANAKRAQLKDTAKELGLAYVETTMGNLKYAECVNLDNRWWVINESDKSIVETHSNRQTARDVAKALSIVVADKKLVTKAA